MGRGDRSDVGFANSVYIELCSKHKRARLDQGSGSAGTKVATWASFPGKDKRL